MNKDKLNDESFIELLEATASLWEENIDDEVIFTLFQCLLEECGVTIVRAEDDKNYGLRW